MARRIRVRIRGQEELAKRLRNLDRRLRGSILERSVRLGAEAFNDTAEDLAPVDRSLDRDSNVLSESFVEQLVERTPGRVVFKAGPEKDAFHGHFQEFGTVHHEPQPFMRPALDEVADDVLELVREAMEDEVRRAVR